MNDRGISLRRDLLIVDCFVSASTAADTKGLRDCFREQLRDSRPVPVTSVWRAFYSAVNNRPHSFINDASGCFEESEA